MHFDGFEIVFNEIYSPPNINIESPSLSTSYLLKIACSNLIPKPMLTEPMLRSEIQMKEIS